jgi:hypothetical protein
MTSREMETEAAKIRRYWTDPTARKFDEWTATYAAPAKPARPPAPEQGGHITAESYRAANSHRPLGTQDVPMLAALTADEWGPKWMDTRERRRKRKRLERYLQSPDPSGLMVPDDLDEQLKDFPDLADRFTTGKE